MLKFIKCLSNLENPNAFTLIDLQSLINANNKGHVIWAYHTLKASFKPLVLNFLKYCCKKKKREGGHCSLARSQNLFATKRTRKPCLQIWKNLRKVCCQKEVMICYHINQPLVAYKWENMVKARWHQYQFEGVTPMLNEEINSLQKS